MGFIKDIVKKADKVTGVGVASKLVGENAKFVDKQARKRLGMAEDVANTTGFGLGTKKVKNQVSQTVRTLGGV